MPVKWMLENQINTALDKNILDLYRVRYAHM